MKVGHVQQLVLNSRARIRGRLASATQSLLQRNPLQLLGPRTRTCVAYYKPGPSRNATLVCKPYKQATLCS
jgi:hypothetical protein